VAGAVSLTVVAAAPGLAEETKLKVAAMLGTPVEEQWVSRVHVAILAAEKRGEIEYLLSEDVKAPDMVRVLRQYAEQGVDLIIGEAYAIEREARELAKEYPDVKFLMGSSLDPQEPNFAVFDNWNQDAAYLGGMLAGGITKSNKIGAVGAMSIPEINRLVGAFQEGACAVNPDVNLLVAYIGSFYDVPGDKEAGLAQIDAGADVLYAERFGANQAALDRGVYAIANLVEQEDTYDPVVITSTLWHSEPFIDAAIKDVKEGKFVAKDYGKEYGPLAAGGADLAPLGEWEAKFPPELIAKIKETEAKMKSGAFAATIFPDEIKSGPCP
jgi:basic membrane lipoprotein Med (substrate-binding protein (PBP1-ABC) superfamily)